MSKRVLCKFFAHGACLKGEHCEFSHDWTDPSNNVCTYYQKGICSYGSRCRYEHVKPSRSDSPRATSPIALPQLQSSDSFYTLQPSAAMLGRTATSPDASVLFPASSGALLVPTEPVWGVDSGHDNLLDDGDALEDPRSVKPAERPICSFAAAGNCPRGEECPHIHGEQCPSCFKHCLHPFRPQEREEHIRSCEKKQQHLEALRRSQEIECSVCLDRVLSKSTAGERKFGLLSECDHPFCVSCIRNWRSTSPSSGMDLNNTLRSCPICRKLSYFVIPSVIWYFSQQEKQDIINNYKAKLRSIDCKHFNFGSGNCPFGTSCFYRHAYRDGRLEEVVLRHLGSEDGSTMIARNVRLSDFLSDLHIT